MNANVNYKIKKYSKYGYASICELEGNQNKIQTFRLFDFKLFQCLKLLNYVHL